MISIIVPIYNALDNLPKLITSVIKQTFIDWELILVDDGSPDSCPQICDDWKKVELVTPIDKEENIKFYTERCGFNIGAREMDGNVEVIKFYMER